jgi:hypothetical protein
MTTDEMIRRMVSEAVRAHRRASTYTLDEGQVQSIVEAVRPLIEAEAIRRVCEPMKDFHDLGLGMDDMLRANMELADDLEAGVWESVTNLTPQHVYSNWDRAINKGW